MPEKKRKYKILAVNPGWRYLGIAVFDEYELREWRLKCLPAIPQKRKLEKVTNILVDYIKRYDLNVLAIKKIHSSRSSSNLESMVIHLMNHCMKKGLLAFTFSLNDVETFLSPQEKINKKRLVEIVVSEYPDLLNEMNRERQNRNPYFLRLFEAVALGHVCFSKLS
jgi:hypothetical protein